MGASDFFEDVGSFCGPDERFWILVVLIDVVADGHDELFEIFEDAAAQLVLGQVAEESFDHIEPAGRGWGEVDTEALVTVQPAGNFLVFVCGIVVADQVDMFFLGDGLVDQAEKLQPLLMPVPLLAEAEDLAVKGVQGRKRCCCVVTFIVMRHRLATSFLQRQAGLVSVQGLYLALFVNAQNQSMLRRVQVQADDGFQLTGKLRVTAYLEGLDQVRLESVCVRDAPTLASLIPTSRAIVRVDQWVASCAWTNGSRWLEWSVWSS
jgi:hypothetical protein